MNLLVVVKRVGTLCYIKRLLVYKILSKLSVLRLLFNQIICYNLIVLFTEVPVKNHLKKHITLWKFVNTLYYILHYYRSVCSMYIVFVTKCNKILLSSFVKYCCMIKKPYYPSQQLFTIVRQWTIKVLKNTTYNIFSQKKCIRKPIITTIFNSFQGFSGTLYMK